MTRDGLRLDLIARIAGVRHRHRQARWLARDRADAAARCSHFPSARGSRRGEAALDAAVPDKPQGASRLWLALSPFVTEGD